MRKKENASTELSDFNLLSEKQKKFCREYLVDFNASRAYLAAGYVARTTNALSVSSSRLLSNAKVHHYLKHILSGSIQDEITNIKRIISELQMIAFGDLKDLADWTEFDLKFKSSNSLDFKSRLISEISSNDKGLKIKMHDKLKALELLGRYYKIFTDKIEAADQNVKITIDTNDSEL